MGALAALDAEETNIPGGFGGALRRGVDLHVPRGQIEDHHCNALGLVAERVVAFRHQVVSSYGVAELLGTAAENLIREVSDT